MKALGLVLASVLAMSQVCQTYTGSVSEKPVDQLYAKSFTIPGYPPVARQGGVMGDVSATLTIDSHGEVSAISRVEGSPFLAGHIIPALKKWVFHNPHGRDVTLLITFRFLLEGGEAQENLVTTLRAESPSLFVISTSPPVRPGPDVEFFQGKPGAPR